MLFSVEEGVTKPDERFYERMCERLDVSAESCLYVGDGAGHELSGAEKAGMTAVLMCDPAEEDIVMDRDEARNWDGARIKRIADVQKLVER
jgi:putative hydrolase of the HAD superfamily